MTKTHYTFTDQDGLTIQVTLTQDPYIAGTYDAPRYEAHAEDEDGGEYFLFWLLKDGIDIREIEDESDACDWSHFTWRSL